MEQTEEAPNAPTFIRVVHSQNDRDFKRNAPSRKVLAENRKDAVKLCSEPSCKHTSDDSKLMKCAKCSTAWYCSKECQRKHWKAHKGICFEPDGFNFQKLCTNFFSNPDLNVKLQLFLVFGLNLLSPSSSPDVLRVIGLNRQDPPTNPQEIEGMLQITHIETDVEGYAVPAEKRFEMWNMKQERLKTAGCSNIHSIVVEAVRRAETENAITTVLSIVPPEVVPMSFASCHEFLNKEIRTDYHNRYKLRSPMTNKDFQIIKEATEVEGTEEKSAAAKLFWKKMNSERIYIPRLAMQVNQAG
ncbi:MYND-type zinc finger protein samB [Abortiporus biennis]